MSSRYSNSESFLKRAENVIPLGSQTFSKSKTQYPLGSAPLFIEKASGARLWDIDGNEYIDFNGALAAITLGHADPDVNAAVTEQIAKGTVYSLSHPIETLVAEEMQKLIPCAEKVRFGKNGSDATAGAIRLARAYTKREHVLVCGYHGWQDWYIGSTLRHLGVPEGVRSLTHTFIYNDIKSLQDLLKKHQGEVAAVIMEPMNAVDPKPGFLQEVAELTRQAGALLVFDETITGFRYDIGGAQKLFGVTPDLATFGKGMGNGFPISALVGKSEYMRIMEDIFFSFTFGGETVSLAASLAVMKKMQREPVLQTIKERGQYLDKKLIAKISHHGLENMLSTSGHPSWVFLNFKETSNYNIWELKTLFLQEIFKRGVLMIGTHNMHYSLSTQDVDKLMQVYDEVFVVMKDANENKSLKEKLTCEVLQPVFRVR